MNSRNHRPIVILLTAIQLCAGFSLIARAADRPNIILIYTDDQAANMTGFEGHPIIQTPNLNRLAAEGTYFSRCYVPTPQCAPSRATILTGQYPHTHGVTTNELSLPEDADTVSARLKQAGYACGIVGKWHLPQENAQNPGFGFVDYIATNQQHGYENAKVFVQGQAVKADKFLTDWNGDRAIEFIEKSQDKPFFLWLSFRAPHSPWLYPPGTENLYPPASIDLPATMNLDTKDWPRELLNSPPALRFKDYNPQTIREERSKYYAMISRVDENIGRVLSRLDELNLTENTAVIFVPDNGLALGEHMLFTKGPAFFEELMRMPLIIRYPKLIKPGTEIDRVVSMVDLAPTFCELAGLKPPVTMQGKSLLPLIENPDLNDRADEAFFEWHRQKNHKRDGYYELQVRGMVTRQYKLINYTQASRMFFDLKRDPNETRNAIKEPEYQAVIKVLQSRIEHWQKQTKDPQFTPANKQLTGQKVEPPPKTQKPPPRRRPTRKR